MLAAAGREEEALEAGRLKGAHAHASRADACSDLAADLLAASVVDHVEHLVVFPEASKAEARAAAPLRAWCSHIESEVLQMVELE